MYINKIEKPEGRLRIVGPFILCSVLMATAWMALVLSTLFVPFKDHDYTWQEERRAEAWAGKLLADEHLYHLSRAELHEAVVKELNVWHIHLVGIPPFIAVMGWIKPSIKETTFVGGQAFPIFRTIITNPGIDCNVEYAYVLAHELMHLKMNNANERKVNFTLWLKLFNSECLIMNKLSAWLFLEMGELPTNYDATGRVITHLKSVGIV